LLKQHSTAQHARIYDIFVLHYNELIIYGLGIKSDKQLVEDCIQDLFLKFCENENLILEANEQIAYLKSSLRRQIIKTKGISESNEISGAKMLDISVPSYEDQLIENQSNIQDALTLKNLMESLTQSQKTILTLRFYKSMSYDEIAEKLDISKRTVYNHVQDAFKKLKNKISENN
jgi:RNA polymerase sigma factor (sigma-70 family)